MGEGVLAFKTTGFMYIIGNIMSLLFSKSITVAYYKKIKHANNRN